MLRQPTFAFRSEVDKELANCKTAKVPEPQIKLNKPKNIKPATPEMQSFSQSCWKGSFILRQPTFASCSEVDEELANCKMAKLPNFRSNKTNTNFLAYNSRSTITCLVMLEG
jgi:hypothetical protein